MKNVAVFHKIVYKENGNIESRKIMKKYICGLINMKKTSWLYFLREKNRELIRNFVFIFCLYFAVRQYQIFGISILIFTLV